MYRDVWRDDWRHQAWGIGQETFYEIMGIFGAIALCTLICTR